MHLFPRSIFKSKREDIANMILGLARGHKSVLTEYLQNKEQKMLEAASDPNEFDEIAEEDIKKLLSEENQKTLDSFPAAHRDRVKLMCLVQMNEAKLPSSGESQNKVL